MTTYEFPVKIGDTVTSWCEDDHVYEPVPLKVHGVAQIGDKQYVIDESGEKYEIGSKFCLGVNLIDERKADTIFREMSDFLVDRLTKERQADNSHLYSAGVYSALNDLGKKLNELFDRLMKGEEG
jgi:hypothetical protein